ncbi:MAG: LacI family DNA-binding transcriptional regulator, partial [Anaerolineae bacterium]|nr:LacI family DNA-binding transcriptional regulator [Anaerolineae bacterium]
ETAITRLGYRPNAIARSMARGYTKTLSFISTNLIDYTFACILDEAERTARLHGYILIASSAPDEETFQDLIDEFIGSQRSEGLIVINAYNDNRYSLVPENVPTVFIGGWDPEKGHEVNSVDQDQASLARLAAQHLVDLGHRRIAMISGPLTEKSARDRVGGFRAVMKELGIGFDQSLVIEGDWSANSGYEAFNQFWQKDQSITAISAHNDRMAVGVLRAAYDRGVAVPEQLSVVGIDDIPLASYFTPSLTTVRNMLPDIGREGVELLIHSIENVRTPPRHVVLPEELIVRSSTRQCQI